MEWVFGVVLRLGVKRAEVSVRFLRLPGSLFAVGVVVVHVNEEGSRLYGRGRVPGVFGVVPGEVVGGVFVEAGVFLLVFPCGD